MFLIPRDTSVTGRIGWVCRSLGSMMTHAMQMWGSFGTNIFLVVLDSCWTILLNVPSAEWGRCLGLGMFFFSLLFYFTNKFIFYLLMMPQWCPTGTVAPTTTTIRWCGRPMTRHSCNNQQPNAMAHHHHLYHHHHPVTWQACDMTWPQHRMSVISSAHMTCSTCHLGFGIFFFFFSFPFFSFPFILFY